MASRGKKKKPIGVRRTSEEESLRRQSEEEAKKFSRGFDIAAAVFVVLIFICMCLPIVDISFDIDLSELTGESGIEGKSMALSLRMSAFQIIGAPLEGYDALQYCLRHAEGLGETKEEGYALFEKIVREKYSPQKLAALDTAYVVEAAAAGTTILSWLAFIAAMLCERIKKKDVRVTLCLGVVTAGACIAGAMVSVIFFAASAEGISFGVGVGAILAALAAVCALCAAAVCFKPLGRHIGYLKSQKRGANEKVS